MADGRIVGSKREDWQQAYNYSGYGSSFDRAQKIDQIFTTAAPVINSGMNELARNFLTQLHKIVQEAVKESEGDFDLS